MPASDAFWLLLDAEQPPLTATEWPLTIWLMLAHIASFGFGVRASH